MSFKMDDPSMDVTQVYMVRSAKHKDMLCVDEYLYHFDGFGRGETYRWLCNRRKDKITPCKSRISTILADPNDSTVHIVQEVCSKHTHPRCSSHEITKVSERKRLANLRGEECTLDTIRPRKRQANFSPKKHSKSQISKQARLDLAEESLTAGQLDFTDKERVFVLRRLDGRVMCCVDGQLYYLNGKSTSCGIYRWICVRKRDISCTSTIYTEPTIAGAHRLHPTETDAHIHLHYAPTKLMQMFEKHSITIVEDEEIEELFEDSVLDFFEEDELNLMKPINRQHDYSSSLGYIDEEESPIIIEEYAVDENGDEFEVVVDDELNDVVAASAEVVTGNVTGMVQVVRGWEAIEEIIANHIPPVNHDPLTETDLSKFVFLPTTRNRKLLCLNQNLYYFENIRSNESIDWRCTMNRNKNCQARIAMAQQENGQLIILRIIGEHNHECNLVEIRKRLIAQESGEPYEDGLYDDIDDDDDDDDVDSEEEEYDENVEANLNEMLNNNVSSGSSVDPTNSIKRKIIEKKFIDDIKQDETLPKIFNIKQEKEYNEDTIESGLDMIEQQQQQHHQQQQQHDIKKDNSNLIVEYLNDGTANISAKINVLPTAALHTETVVTTTTSSTPITATTTTTKTAAAANATKIVTNRANSQARQQTVSKPKSTSGAAQQSSEQQLECEMDLYKICKLRSAKGNEMLCVDGFIYQAKNKGVISRNYWVCIKARDPDIMCSSRMSTAMQRDGSVRILRVYNNHNHPVNEEDIKRRLFNEVNTRKRGLKRLQFKPLHFIEKSLAQINSEYGDLAIERLHVSSINPKVLVHKPFRYTGQRITPDDEDSKTMRRYQAQQESRRLVQSNNKEDEILVENELIEEEIEEDYNAAETIIQHEDESIIEEVSEVVEYDDIEPIYSMKLYAVSDGPPSLAVRMALRALNIEYQLINVDFCALEHRSEQYAKMNPQKEIPVLDDDGFYLSESMAIMQYLCDKYATGCTLYPQDVNTRALVNQRLCFNMNYYYGPIGAHTMAPIFFDYQRTPMTLKKVKNALDVFETYLQRTGTKYVASDDLTIADLALVSATLCLEAIGFDLSPYTQVARWYDTFKEEYPVLWEIADSGMQEIREFEKNPPDLSHMEHPFHPTRKITNE